MSLIFDRFLPGDRHGRPVMIKGGRGTHGKAVAPHRTALAEAEIWAWEARAPRLPEPPCLGGHPLGDAHWRTMGRLARPVSILSNVPPPLPAVGCRRDDESGGHGITSRSLRTWRYRRYRRIHRRDVRSRKKGGDCVGRCRAGKATKVMAIADRHGLPLAVAIAPGQRHDSVLTDRTLEAAFVERLPPRLIADRAWDSQKWQDILRKERGIELIAPRKKRSRRKQDGRSLRRYNRRWKVERLFAWLKRFRRIETRHECKAANYLGFLHLACAIILLRQF